MTTTSRRALLGATTLALIGAPFASPSAASAAVRRPRSLYHRMRFTPQLGRKFRLVDGRTSHVVKLTEIYDFSSVNRGDNRNFGLTLRARRSGPPQGTYVLRRAGFKPTSLFVVPSDANRRTYQVTISRVP